MVSKKVHYTQQIVQQSPEGASRRIPVDPQSAVAASGDDAAVWDEPVDVVPQAVGCIPDQPGTLAAALLDHQNCVAITKVPALFVGEFQWTKVGTEALEGGGV